MILRLRIGADDNRDPQWRVGHRALSWFYSAALHGGFAAFAFLGPEVTSAPPPRTYRSTVVELEKDHKLIYYDFRKQLPEVSPANAPPKPSSPGPNPLKAAQRIVVAPQEVDGKQFVYLPEPKVKLRTELKAPNLIAVETPVKVPLPEKPKLKTFQPPELVRKTPAPLSTLPSAPAVASVNSPKPSAEVSALLNKPLSGPPPKQFVMPKAAPHRQPAAPAALPGAPTLANLTGEKPGAAVSALLNQRLSGPPPREFVMPKGTRTAHPAGPAALPSAPAVSGIATDRPSAEISSLLNKPLSGPPPRPFTAPAATRSGKTGSAGGGAALPAAPAVASNAPSASATIAIIGLNPVDVPHIPAPEGSRPARILAGTPTLGTRPELGGGNGGVTVPGVSIQGRPGNSPAIATPSLQDRTAPPAGLAHPQPPQVLPATPHVSVPQWPTNRTLPAAVEHHFQNRVVYVTVIPGESGQDWVVWFAEFTPASVDAHLLMRPPILLHSSALPPIPANADHGTGSLRIVGTLHKDGHLDAASDLSGARLDKELTLALRSWQFSPATRDGSPIEADTVLQIPVVFGKLSLR